MPKSFELQSNAIQEVITTMSQIAIIDTAMSAVRARVTREQDEEFDSAIDAVHELLDDVQTVDFTPDLLNGFTDMLLKDADAFAAEKLAVDAVIGLAETRRLAVKRRQEVYAKQLRRKKVNITPLRNNIVVRGASKDTYMKDGQLREGFEPIRAYETFMMGLSNSSSGPAYPHTLTGRPPYKNFNGYSLSGHFIGKTKANRYFHEVSIVDSSGVPIVEITP